MEGKDSNILLKKQWFIATKPGKPEDYYTFDIKKVVFWLM